MEEIQPLSAEELVELETIEAKMTPGDWFTDQHRNPCVVLPSETSKWVIGQATVAPEQGFRANECGRRVSKQQARANAAGIVALRNAFCRLLATLRERDELLAALVHADPIRKFDPYDGWGDFFCNYCSGRAKEEDGGDAVVHDEDCPWRRARERVVGVRGRR